MNDGRPGGRSDLTALRFLGAGVSTIPFLVWRLQGLTSRVPVYKTFGIMLFQGASYSIVYLTALGYSAVVYGATIIPGIQPLVVILLSFFLLGERVRPMRGTGLAIAVLGIFIILLGSNHWARSDHVLGIALYVCAGIMWGTYTFLIRYWSIGAWDALSIIVLSGVIFFLPPYFMARGVSLFEGDARQLLQQFLYQGVLVGFVAVALMVAAVTRIGPVRVAMISPAMPALAILFAWLWLGEAPSLVQWVGIAVVTSGMAISSYTARKA